MRGNSRNTLTQILVANFAAAAQPTAGVLVDKELLEIKRLLDQRMLKLTDASIYNTKDASSAKLIRLFETSDVEAKGITNITAGKLALNQVVMVDRIRLLAASSGAAINGSAAVLGALNFGTIAGHGSLTGGSLTIRQQNKNINYELSLRVFDTTGRVDRANGIYHLESPLLLRPQQLIEATLDLGLSLPDRQAVRIELLGTQTSPF